MAQAFRTQIVSGYFDCRIFRQGVAKENRQMKPEGDTVSFNVGFAEYPQEFAKNGAAEYIREAEVNGLKRWYVTFKVEHRSYLPLLRQGRQAHRPSRQRRPR